MKRFTETGKWSDPWYRKLSPKQKCLWQYVCDSCDAAGVIDLDLESASFHIGGKITRGELASIESRLLTLPDGKLMIRAFIPFQYGALSTECRPHKSVFDALARHGLQYPIDTLLEGYQYPSGLDKEKDMDKEKDKKGVQGDFPATLNTPEFAAAWERYVEYRKAQKLKPLQPASVQARLEELAGWGVEVSILAINQTIANGWQGIFHPRANHTPASDREKKKANEYPLRGSGPRVVTDTAAYLAELQATKAAAAEKKANGNAD